VIPAVDTLFWRLGDAWAAFLSSPQLLHVLEVLHAAASIEC
jgi:hypothetical protein